MDEEEDAVAVVENMVHLDMLDEEVMNAVEDLEMIDVVEEVEVEGNKVSAVEKVDHH